MSSPAICSDLYLSSQPDSKIPKLRYLSNRNVLFSTNDAATENLMLVSSVHLLKRRVVCRLRADNFSFEDPRKGLPNYDQQRRGKRA